MHDNNNAWKKSNVAHVSIPPQLNHLRFRNSQRAQFLVTEKLPESDRKPKILSLKLFLENDV